MEDQVACNLIAVSIGRVMRQSLDNDFKEACKSLLGVTSTSMVEETLHKKLLHIAENGSSSSTKKEKPLANQSRSSATEEESVQIPKLTEVKIHQNLLLGEMYRQTMKLQKHSLSPQPADKTESRSKLLKCLQNSAPF